MNLVLIGYRGTGKSAVGRILSERLGMKTLSMDAEIVKRAGMSIPEIVDKFGWPGFRDRESELAEDLSKKDGIIIDCGGGIIERPENIEALKKNGVIVWFNASVDTIVKRIEGDTERPSLTGGKSFTEEVCEVLERRMPKYREAADHEVDTNKHTEDEVAAAVIDIWKGL